MHAGRLQDKRTMADPQDDAPKAVPTQTRPSNAHEQDMPRTRCSGQSPGSLCS